jgi:hypothetical protein
MKEEYEDRLKEAENELRPLMMKLYADQPGPEGYDGSAEGGMPGMHGMPSSSGPKVEEVD